MAGLAKHFDSTSMFIITITAALFTLALLVKGLTHDMLLEAGVLDDFDQTDSDGIQEQRRHAFDPNTELKKVRAMLERQEPAASETPRHTGQRR